MGSTCAWPTMSSIPLYISSSVLTDFRTIFRISTQKLLLSRQIACTTRQTSIEKYTCPVSGHGVTMVSVFYAATPGFTAMLTTHCLALLLEYEIVLDSHRHNPFGFSIVFFSPERRKYPPGGCSKFNSYFRRHTLLGTMETQTGMALAGSAFPSKSHAVTLAVVDPVF